ncbi:hypothetical protein DFJ74DRAFT_703951 [Hyaloraphidium curvatum]|nr:hypothetical protein DFJ74DRAFT_703951 [Hyaloraphidium curvatum]
MAANGSAAAVKAVATTPFTDQRPGTSGLRKRVTVFTKPNYTENFVQAILSSIPEGAEGATLVVGGDGRYFAREAVQIIAKLAAGNKVKKLIVGQDSILSTPAASNVIRKRKATGGILLTASHNPGGPDADFGIKYNMSNGGPAPESVTEKIFEVSKELKEYHMVDLPEVDLKKLGSQKYGPLEVEVIDSVADYLELMQEIFDFELIKSFFKKRPDFTVLMDSLNGVTGPYCTRILVDSLGLPPTSVVRNVPLVDFGGGHPDPNLTYAHELVEQVNKEGIAFGAASDGDGDRNMIIGNNWFVNPCDSVAIIAANADAIPYFKKSGLKGVARSMPTSGALDRVAAKKGMVPFETPTGWKFFGNLMDAGKLSICGEESFGTGSDHIREKDGLWAVLAWLNIIAAKSQADPKVTVKSICMDHFKAYGRNYFSRYDFEEVDGEGANNMNAMLREAVGPKRAELIGKEMAPGLVVKDADDFSYTDPIDGSVSSKQGVRLLFADGSRIIYRLSGTGSHGATVRIYFEQYEGESFAMQALKTIIKVGLDFSKLKEYTGRDKPTVIT